MGIGVGGLILGYYANIVPLNCLAFAENRHQAENDRKCFNKPLVHVF